MSRAEPAWAQAQSPATTPVQSLPATPAPTRPDALALTVSGGVSLGAYQAGYLYFAIETMRRFPGPPPLRLVTGASAGSINALIALLSSCRPPGADPDPDQSLFWHSWIDLGFHELFDPARASAISIFTRDRMLQLSQEVRTAWNQGLTADCDVVLGVSVTRLESAAILLHADLEIPHQEEKFSLRVRGRGPGRVPRVTNYVDPHYHLPQPLLPLADDGDDEAALAHNLDPIRNLLFASAAFPIAFAPERLAYCMSEPPADRAAPAGGVPAGERGAPAPASLEPICKRPDHVDDFIDGGVFDNRPLGLAVRMATRGLRRRADGTVGWRDLSADPAHDEGEPLPRDALHYAYLDPDNTAYPSPVEPTHVLGPKLLVPTVARLTEAFVNASRAKELYTLAQTNPTLSKQMTLTRRYFPTASGQLFNFLGFFEREFRRYDFYLGMYDAYKGFRLPGSPAPPGLPWLDGVGGRDITGSWRPFACMLATFEGRPALAAACDGNDLRDFRILLQLSLDRLYTECALPGARSPAPGLAHQHCERAAAGQPPPHVPGVVALPAAQWRRRESESDLDQVLRLLAAYQFEFHDLGLRRDEAQFGRVRLRRKLIKLFNTVADLQPDFSDSVLLKTAGRTLANRIAYEPPRSWVYLVVGSYAELGASVLPFDWNRSWARLNLALQFDGLGTMLSDTDKRVSILPALGPELELLFMTSQWFQPMLGGRIGYHFDTRDDLGSDLCTAARSHGDARQCSGPIVQGYLALGIYERVRIQLTETYQLFATSFDDRHLSTAFGIGFQFF